MSFKTVRPSPEAGFTLIEILVAVAILATIAGMVVMSFSSTIRLRDAAQSESGREHLARNSLRVMTEELAAGRRHSSGPWIGHNAVVDGQPADLLVFNALANVRTQPNAAEADISRVAYTREGDRLVRYSIRNPYVLVPEAIDRVELSAGVTAFNLRYFDRKIGTWVDEWSAGSASTQLPGGILIELTLLNSRQEPRTYTAWVPPTPSTKAIAVQSGPPR